MKINIAEYIKTLQSGHVCLHPTDTLFGLTFDPVLAKAKKELLSIKGYADAEEQSQNNSRPFIGLAASTEQALAAFAPLPGSWEQRLRQIWPNPISIIWKAADTVPETLLADDPVLGKTIALRVPNLIPADAWFAEVLRAFPYPLPSSSVNSKNQPALIELQALQSFCQSHGVYCPEGILHSTAPSPSPVAKSSTLIKLQADGSFILLREGAYNIT